MTATRRDFLERVTGSAALFGALPLIDMTPPETLVRVASLAEDEFDLSWTKRFTGKHRVVLDVSEINSGYGVWRAIFWADQYKQVLGASDKDVKTVLVMRHNGIALAMKQSYWDEYGIGKAKNVLHPVTQQPTDKNPALMVASDNVPPPFVGALEKFIANGGIALGCNLAFDECVGRVKEKHKLDDAAARKQAIGQLVPGVLLQPSGVFAVIRAQEAGGVYVSAA